MMSPTARVFVNVPNVTALFEASMDSSARFDPLERATYPIIPAPVPVGVARTTTPVDAPTLFANVTCANWSAAGVTPCGNANDPDVVSVAALPLLTTNPNLPVVSAVYRSKPGTPGGEAVPTPEETRGMRAPP